MKHPRQGPQKAKHKLPDGVRIPNIEALDDAIDDGNKGFAILLAGGAAFSRKTITRKDNKYRVRNHIDGSMQVLTKGQLLDDSRTNIGVAMKKGRVGRIERIERVVNQRLET